ncbi:MAG: hypothetical protein F7B20_01200 [Aeropyrum sp.]|nr:hypothetical protein [Aeropyrum sp.]MCE4616933.1 hypothetical protein [Aeropyrum sp.]
MTLVSLPYYSFNTADGSLYLEAYLSRYLSREEICLLASRKPADLSQNPRGLEAKPWGEPHRVLEFYVRMASELIESKPTPYQGLWGWYVRRLVQELNRLIAGGLAGPPIEPRQEDAIRNRLARRLCKDVLGGVVGGGRAVYTGVMWRVVRVRREGGNILVEKDDGSLDRIVGWLLERNPAARGSLTKLIALD